MRRRGPCCSPIARPMRCASCSPWRRTQRRYSRVTGPNDVVHTVWRDGAGDRSRRSRPSSTRWVRSTSPTAIIAPRRPRESRRSGAARPTRATSSFSRVAFPHDEMRILDYNRVVRDLNGLSPDALLARIRESFAVAALSGAHSPAQPEDVRDVSRRPLVRAEDPRGARAAHRSRREPRREPAPGSAARADA